MNRKQQLNCDHILDNINKSLTFDIREIYECGDPIIFGGAVRDSISNMKINDVDIICGSNTYKSIADFLKRKNYTSLKCIYDTEDSDLVSGDKCECDFCKTRYEIEWFQVLTFRSQKRNKFQVLAEQQNKALTIQLIVPDISFFVKKRDADTIKNFNYYNKVNSQHIYKMMRFITQQVDLSCCGVSINKLGQEFILHSIGDHIKKQCLNKVFEIYEFNEFFSFERSIKRADKLISRGWTCLNYQKIKNKQIVKETPKWGDNFLDGKFFE